MASQHPQEKVQLSPDIRGLNTPFLAFLTFQLLWELRNSPPLILLMSVPGKVPTEVLPSFLCPGLACMEPDPEAGTSYSAQAIVVPTAASPLDWKPLKSKAQACPVSGSPHCQAQGLVHGKSPENATEIPRSFFSLQEDILEELLSDMALVPGPNEGHLSLAMATQQPPELLLSPSLDIPAPCPNSEPPENPLRQLLVPEEGECLPWGERDWGGGPPHTLSTSFHFHIAAAAAQHGSSR